MRVYESLFLSVGGLICSFLCAALSQLLISPIDAAIFSISVLVPRASNTPASNNSYTASWRVLALIRTFFGAAVICAISFSFGVLIIIFLSPLSVARLAAAGE